LGWIFIVSNSITFTSSFNLLRNRYF